MSRLVIDEQGRRRVVDARAFARDELPRAWNLAVDDEACALAALCAEGGAEQELFDTAAALDDARALCAAAQALAARAASLPDGNAGHVARLGERAATRAGRLDLAAENVRAGRSLPPLDALVGIPVPAPFWNLGAPPAPAARRVLMAPLAVDAMARPEDRVLARGLAVHLADSIAGGELVVVAGPRAKPSALFAPDRPWDLPVLLQLLPAPAPGDVILAGSLRRLGNTADASVVVDVAGLSRDDMSILFQIAAPPADLPRRVVDALKGRRARHPGENAPLPALVLEVKAALVGPFLVAAGALDDHAALGAGAALLAAAPLLEQPERTDDLRLAIAAAVIGASLGYAAPPALLARIEGALTDPERSPVLAALTAPRGWPPRGSSTRPHG